MHRHRLRRQPAVRGRRLRRGRRWHRRRHPLRHLGHRHRGHGHLGRAGRRLLPLRQRHLGRQHGYPVGQVDVRLLPGAARPVRGPRARPGRGLRAAGRGGDRRRRQGRHAVPQLPRRGRDRGPGREAAGAVPRRHPRRRRQGRDGRPDGRVLGQRRRHPVPPGRVRRPARSGPLHAVHEPVRPRPRRPPDVPGREVRTAARALRRLHRAAAGAGGLGRAEGERAARVRFREVGGRSPLDPRRKPRSQPHLQPGRARRVRNHRAGLQLGALFRRRRRRPGAARGRAPGQRDAEAGEAVRRRRPRHAQGLAGLPRDRPGRAAAVEGLRRRELRLPLEVPLGPARAEGALEARRGARRAHAWTSSSGWARTPSRKPAPSWPASA